MRDLGTGLGSTAFQRMAMDEATKHDPSNGQFTGGGGGGGLGAKAAGATKAGPKSVSERHLDHAAYHESERKKALNSGNSAKMIEHSKHWENHMRMAKETA